MILSEATKAELVKKSTAIIAERVRIERVEFFKRISTAEKSLRAMLDHYTEKITSEVEDKGHTPKNAKRISAVIHNESMNLRASLRIWIRAAIRDSAKMGFRHIGDALLPIFKANRKTMEQTLLVERALYEAWVDRTLLEDKLTFGVNATLAGTAGTLQSALYTKKWLDKTAQIIKKVAQGSLAGRGKIGGYTPSARVWDYTSRAEQDIKRIVANGMANGENPSVMARRIRKYVSPALQDASDLGVEPGQGVYRSPYKNAMRLARTEMNRTYVKAQVAFAKDKPWIDGMDITLSRVHAEEDECDDLAAGGPYTPAEVDELIPAHPHCMCRGTPRIDPKYLGDDSEEE